MTVKKQTVEYNKMGLWKTSGGRIVLDSHNNETFCEPYDTKLATIEELTNGISLRIFLERLVVK